MRKNDEGASRSRKNSESDDEDQKSSNSDDVFMEYQRLEIKRLTTKKLTD